MAKFKVGDVISIYVGPEYHKYEVLDVGENRYLIKIIHTLDIVDVRIKTMDRYSKLVPGYNTPLYKILNNE